MATAECVPNESRNMNSHVELRAGERGISEILEAVQGYLNSWSKERIVNLQKIDGGWAPFDESQQPLQVFSVAALHCNRIAIHRHCIALREAGMPLTPELVELGEFFYNASKLIEDCEDPALRRWTPETRTPPTPTHRDVLVNW